MSEKKKKLSEFVGQEHITSVLRAMVIKRDVRPIAFLGNLTLARQIADAYHSALVCLSPVRGDACGECIPCKRGHYFYPIDAAYGSVPDGYLAFETKTSMGSEINKKLLVHLIFVYREDKEMALHQIRELAQEQSLTEFVRDYLEIFKNILHLKHNLEIAEKEKLEDLSQLAVRLQVPTLIAAMRVLWDAESKTTLPANLAIEVTAALLSEAIKPTPVIEYQQFTTFDGSTPISNVETTIEQPLKADELLAIAHE